MQFYISRTFQSPHQLRQHIQAAFLSPPRGTGVWSQYQPLCSPELPAQGLACLSRETSPTTSSVSTQLLSQVRTRVGSQRQQGDKGLQLTEPSHSPAQSLYVTETEIFGILCFLSCTAPKKNKFLVWPHFLDQNYFLGFFFSALRTQYGLGGTNRARYPSKRVWRKGRPRRAVIFLG